MKKILTQPKLVWFSSTLSKYYGSNIQVTYKEKKLYLSVNGKMKVIFDNINLDFYKVGKSDINCIKWNPNQENLENIFDNEIFSPGFLCEKVFDFSGNLIICHYDILGLMFWCLNRLEEIGSLNLDKHNRFNFKESHAYNYNYIEYPIVDQWLYFLKKVIEIRNPEIFFKKNKYQIIATHDIDRPSRYHFKSIKGFLRASFGDFIRDKDIKKFFGSFSRFFNSNRISDNDPFYTFNYLMSTSEQKKIKSRFYFICGGLSKFDADYSINNKIIKEIINSILERGHEVGLHPSYDCYLNKNQIKKEMDNLKNILSDSNSLGGRMHYLRFKYPDTLYYLSDAGLIYDSTLGYAENIGFRCGTCFEYTPFDPIKDCNIDITILPLILMDVTLTTYMGLNKYQAIEKSTQIKKRCKAVGGNFVLLWHNSELKNSDQREVYESLLNEC